MAILCCVLTLDTMADLMPYICSRETMKYLGRGSFRDLVADADVYERAHKPSLPQTRSYLSPGTRRLLLETELVVSEVLMWSEATPPASVYDIAAIEAVTGPCRPDDQAWPDEPELGPRSASGAFGVAPRAVYQATFKIGDTLYQLDGERQRVRVDKAEDWTLIVTNTTLYEVAWWAEPPPCSKFPSKHDNPVGHSVYNPTTDPLYLKSKFVGTSTHRGEDAYVFESESTLEGAIRQYLVRPEDSAMLQKNTVFWWRYHTWDEAVPDDSVFDVASVIEATCGKCKAE